MAYRFAYPPPSQAEAAIASLWTDAFGEFKIDRLEPDSGHYELHARSPLGHVSAGFDLGGESRYLGVLTLEG
jgi:hypothetical protein